jgi:hypothetical protein
MPREIIQSLGQSKVHEKVMNGIIMTLLLHRESFQR